MIQFDVLAGKMAGTRVVARRFPVRVGRAPGNDLRLEDDGVWDRHFTLEFDGKNGFALTTAANALATIKGIPVQNALLRNGDIIDIGSARLQFWLAATRQNSLRLSESAVWTLVAAVILSQFILIYSLLR